MFGKKIYRLTNLELHDGITSGSDLFSVKELTMELDSGELSRLQREKLEIDYIKYKEIEQKRLNQLLTTQE